MPSRPWPHLGEAAECPLLMYTDCTLDENYEAMMTSSARGFMAL